LALLFTTAAGAFAAVKKAEYSTYSNGRFGFSMKYEKNMMKPGESENGDGAVFYSRNGTDIRAYAGYVIGTPDEEINYYLPQTTSSKLFFLKNGYLIYDNNTKAKVKTLNLIFINNSTHYHFDFTMKYDFYNAYKAVAGTMLKSVSPLQSKEFSTPDAAYFIDNLDKILGGEAKALAALKKKVRFKSTAKIVCNNVFRTGGKTYYLFCDLYDEYAPSYAVEYVNNGVYLFQGRNKPLKSIK